MRRVSLIHIFVVALVQGITEFLPISSQAHLILVPRVTGWCDQGLLMDIAVHVGTLGAVTAYLWRECLGMTQGAFDLARGRSTANGRLLLFVVLATLPVLAAGYAVKELLGLEMRSLGLIAWATIVFGVVLWAADHWGVNIRRLEHMSWSSALVIGCFQAVALIPGTSRSGITMTAARLLGFERIDAARFSMLLAIPVIIAAGTLAGIDLVKAGNAQLTHAVLLATALAFVAAFVAIVAMMGWLRRATFTPFVIYRLILGAGLLIAMYGFGVSDSALTAACPS
jgi:undecaprenyl-diphosphatase